MKSKKIVYSDQTKRTRRRIYQIDFSVWMVLLVSFGASMYTWFNISGLSSATTSWGIILAYVMIATGATAEIVKKVSITIYLHKGVWFLATVLSVFTAVAGYHYADKGNKSASIAGSPEVRAVRKKIEEFENLQAPYAYASKESINDLDNAINENHARRVGNNGFKRHSITSKQFLTAKKTLLKTKDAKIKYESYQTMIANQEEKLEKELKTSVSTIPLLKNKYVSEEMMKNILFLFIILVLEYVALVFGSKSYHLKKELMIMIDNDRNNQSAIRSGKFQNGSMLNSASLSDGNPHSGASPKANGRRDLTKDKSGFGRDDSGGGSNLGMKIRRDMKALIKGGKSAKTKGGFRSQGEKKAAVDSLLLGSPGTKMDNEEETTPENKQLMKILLTESKNAKEGDLVLCPCRCEQVFTKKSRKIFNSPSCGTKFRRAFPKK